VSAATALGIYTHITKEMQNEAAAKIDWGTRYRMVSPSRNRSE